MPSSSHSTLCIHPVLQFIGILSCFGHLVLHEFLIAIHYTPSCLDLVTLVVDFFDLGIIFCQSCVDLGINFV